VVGSPSSTLSWYVRELRALSSGLPPSSFFFRDSSGDRDREWGEYNMRGVLRFAP
jgi:hypothetical protein